MTHLFILNSFAGTFDATPEIKAQIKALAIPNAVIEYTQKAGDAELIARRYAEKGDALRVYACGGDGTANEALHGLMGFENVALGVIPIGTGNDYVRSLPGKTADYCNVDKMVRGTTKRVDLLKCEDRYALNVVSVGYDCEVADRAQKNKRLPLMSGPLAYKLAIVQCLLTKRKHTFTPYADGKRIPVAQGFKSRMLAVAAKGKYYGGGMKMAATCGAVTGGLMVLGMQGIEDAPTIGAYLRTIRENHSGCLDCGDLLRMNKEKGGKRKPHCDGMVYESTELVEKIIAERKGNS